ncbi:MAG: hypothetical protein ABW104_18035 [Candidatus Thiodiazotropha sp. 6PLUC2]|nr:hypothetical protein [Candidatus Thiodiazotropha lotti]MCW4218805.1 hypothetical protein [Candidatus Thiodiazotropha lotti]
MKNPANKLIEIYSQNLSYCDPDLKNAFHSEAKKVLRKLAKLMGLTSADYDLRSNKAGIAVSGEITLHTSNLYLQVEKTCMGDDAAIMMRSCKGRKDFVGGMNHFAPISALEDLEQFAIYLEGIARNQVCGMHWDPLQVRFDVANIRANKIISPELERVRDRFEDNEIPIEVFEQAINNAERVRSAA